MKVVMSQEQREKEIEQITQEYQDCHSYIYIDSQKYCRETQMKQQCLSIDKELALSAVKRIVMPVKIKILPIKGDHQEG